MLSRRPDVTSETVDGRAVLIPPSGQEIITLNAVGTLIWDALEEPRELADLTAFLLERLTGVEPADLRRDLDGFLRELGENDLIDGYP